MTARANEFLVWRAGRSVDWDCSQVDIAREVGLSQQEVSRIFIRRGWRTIGDGSHLNRDLTVNEVDALMSGRVMRGVTQ